MLKSKAFWYGNMAASVGAWIFGISGLLCPFENPSIRITSLIIFWSFLVLHPLELAMSIPVCKKAGIPVWKSSRNNGVVKVSTYCVIAFSQAFDILHVCLHA